MHNIDLTGIDDINKKCTNTVWDIPMVKRKTMQTLFLTGAMGLLLLT